MKEDERKARRMKEATMMIPTSLVGLTKSEKSFVNRLLPKLGDGGLLVDGGNVVEASDDDPARAAAGAEGRKL